ncbi:DUF6293 family protein, partial [Candidatus Altiarchaeota archaeon]
KEQPSEGYKESISLPTYSIDPPPQHLLDAMEMINRYDRATQKTVVQDLVKEGKLREVELRGDKQLDDNALYAQFRRKYLVPLEEKAWVKREGRRRNATVSLTKEGENTLKTFG